FTAVICSVKLFPKALPPKATTTRLPIASPHFLFYKKDDAFSFSQRVFVLTVCCRCMKSTHMTKRS
ncbi:hypothetical protein, partial [Enterococcus faecium]|uniref:hypothetical protein n=1 Tax=Enterococcus faecium TaxID=1352 RepID=UPI003171188D